MGVFSNFVEATFRAMSRLFQHTKEKGMCATAVTSPPLLRDYPVAAQTQRRVYLYTQLSDPLRKDREALLLIEHYEPPMLELDNWPPVQPTRSS